MLLVPNTYLQLSLQKKETLELGFPGSIFSWPARILHSLQRRIYEEPTLNGLVFDFEASQTPQRARSIV